MAVEWINSLDRGQNQYTAPHLLSPSETQIMVNVTQENLGAWMGRPGAELFLARISASNPIRGLHSYEKDDGNNYMHAVHDGNLYVAGGSFASQQASLFSSASSVEFVNYLGRHYLIGSGNTEYLSYVTETGNATVVSGNIEGKYLATNGARLVVTGGSTNPRRTYFSEVNTDSFTVARDFFDSSSLPIGAAAFGNGRPFVIFCKNSYMVVDPDRRYADEVEGFGCASHRSIANVNGALIWLSQNRSCWYMLKPNQAIPTKISRIVENKATGDSIVSKINNWTTAAAGSIGNRYFCALGDLSGTVRGQTLNDCVVEYDVESNTWKTHTYTTGGVGSVFATHTVDGSVGLYSGSLDNGAVYRIDESGQFGDDNSLGNEQSVTRTIRTRHTLFGAKGDEMPNMKNIIKQHFLYSCEAEEELTVKQSYNGTSTYGDTYTLGETTSGQLWDWNYIDIGEECKSVSTEFSWDGDIRIYSHGYEVESLGNPGISGS